MNSAAKLKRLIKSVFRSQNLAVLATHHKGQPYTSLVAFAASADLKSLLFATTRTTRKYANIRADSRVALLVDTRENRDTDFHNAVAVTATGRAAEVRGAAKVRLQKVYISRHPCLEEFLKSLTCALLRVKVERYHVVNRFQNVMELRVR